MVTIQKLCTAIDLPYKPVSVRYAIEPVMCMVQDSAKEMRVCCGALITGAKVPWFITSYHMFDSSKPEVYQVVNRSGTMFAYNVIATTNHDILTGEVTDQQVPIGPFGLSMPKKQDLRGKLLNEGILKKVMDVTCVTSGERATITHARTYKNLFRDGSVTLFTSRLATKPGHSGRVFIHLKTKSFFVLHGSSEDNIALFSHLNNNTKTAPP
jgi:hypothetical protein